MKTMLWKELRENLKWAALAVLGLTLAEFHALTGVKPSIEVIADISLCSSAFLLTTAFGSPVVGIALALVQILPELRRDQWAALLHRPTPRGTIFFGKAIAGLLLYFAAALMAFAVSASYAATPGHFAAPLVPGMLVPGLSDIFLGATAYSASLLLCLDCGHWFGRRGVIAFSFIAVFLQHLNSGWPFSVPLVFTVLYLLAGWDAILRQGEYKSIVARSAFVLVLLIGAEVIVLAPIFGLQFLPQKNKPRGTDSAYFEVAPNGQVFIFTSHAGGGMVMTDAKTGQAINPKNGPRDWLNMLPLAWEIGKQPKPYLFYFERQPRNLAHYLRLCYEPMSRESWFLLQKENYFIGYDNLSRRAVGICDADGFKPPTALPRPFPQPLADCLSYGHGPHLFWAGPHVYSLDFPERSMIRYEVQDDTVYGGVAVESNYLQEKPGFIALALEKGVRLLNAEGKPIATVPYPHDPARWPALEIGTNDAGDRIYLDSEPSFAFLWDPQAPVKEKLSAYLDEIDLQGNVLNSYSKPDPRFSVSSSPGNARARIAMLASPLLPALIGTAAQFNLPGIQSPSIDGYQAIVFPQPSLQVSVSDLAQIFLIDFVLAGIAFVWAQRGGLSGSSVRLWALFVLCFGPAGLIVFRLAATWLTHARCPLCGQRRALEKEECSYCHELWPSPPASGTEIFDFEKADV